VMNLNPNLQDTTKLRALLVSSPDDRHITIRWSKIAGSDGDLLRSAVAVYDTLGASVLRATYWDPSDSSRLVLYTEPRSASMTYLVTIPGDSLVRKVSGTAQQDTISVKVKRSNPSGSSSTLDTKPLGWIAFDDLLGEVDFAYRCSLIVSDTILIPVRTTVEEGYILKWSTDSLLAEGIGCQFRLNLLGLTDKAGNACLDTTYEFSFRTFNSAETGAIGGLITGGKGRIRVTAMPLTGRGEDGAGVTAAEDGSYIIDALRAGKYVVWAFIDRDNNNLYGYGSLLPFSFAERFTFSPDTVEVRARWETGAIDFEFK